MFYFPLLDIDTNTEASILNACHGKEARLLSGPDKTTFCLEVADGPTCHKIAEDLGKTRNSRLMLLASRISTEADGRFHNARY